MTFVFPFNSAIQRFVDFDSFGFGCGDEVLQSEKASWTQSLDHNPGCGGMRLKYPGAFSKEALLFSSVSITEESRLVTILVCSASCHA